MNNLELLLHVQLDLFGIAILAILYFNARRTYPDRFYPDRLLFNGLVLATTIMLLLDMASWAFEGIPVPVMINLHWIVMTLYFIISPVPSFMWLCYGDIKMFVDGKGLIKRLPIYLLPLLLNTVFVLLSIKTGWVFSIDSVNDFHRGPFMWIVMLCSWIYLLTGIIMAIVCMNRMMSEGRRFYIFFILLPMIPIVCVILQLQLYGLSLIWEGMVIGILLAYIFIQNMNIFIDPLTGVNNRNYLQTKLFPALQHQLKTGKSIFLMVMDLDGFKYINDTFGHLEGDLVLKSLANLLEATKIHGSTVCRYGGDEFILAGVCANQNTPSELEHAILDAVYAYNHKMNTAHQISLSIGWTVYDQLDAVTIDTMINKADEYMYMKKLHKNKPL